MQTKTQIADAILKSGMFDQEWYKQNINADWKTIDPIDHFLTIGTLYLQPPSPEFDMCKYTTAYPLAASSALNPLYHFLTIGRKNGYRRFKVNSPFDEATYYNQVNEAINLNGYRHHYKRIAIIKATSQRHRVTNALYHYIEALHAVTDGVILVSQDYFPHHEIIKIRHMLIGYACGPDNEAECSWERGWKLARPILPMVEECIFCDTRLLGPLVPLDEFFSEVSEKDKASSYDAWTLGRFENGDTPFKLVRLRRRAQKDLDAVLPELLTLRGGRFKTGRISARKYFLSASQQLVLDSDDNETNQRDCCRGVSALLGIGAQKAEKVRASGITVILPLSGDFEQDMEAAKSVGLDNGHEVELILIGSNSSAMPTDEIVSYIADDLQSNKVKYLAHHPQESIAGRLNSALDQARYDWIMHATPNHKFPPDFFPALFREIENYSEYDAFYTYGVSFEDADLDDHTAAGASLCQLGGLIYNRKLFQEKFGADADADLIFLKNISGALPVKILPFPNLNINRPRFSIAPQFRTLTTDDRPSVATIVLADNCEAHIEQALLSAQMQEGDFQHKIIICHSSNDDAAGIIKSVASSHPDLFIEAGEGAEAEKSALLQACHAEAQADFVCYLDGNDFWCDPRKVQDQIRFLMHNPDCALCISAHYMLDANDMNIGICPIQESLPQRFSAARLLEEPDFLGGISGFMARGEMIAHLPPIFRENLVQEYALVALAENYGPLGFLPQRQFVRRKNGDESDSAIWNRIKHMKIAATVASDPTAYEKAHLTLAKKLFEDSQAAK